MADFVFSYEHKARELESLVLLKLELERRGYTVAFFGSYERDVTKILQGRYLSPKVVVVSALYNPGVLSYFSTQLFGFKKKVANLQWEQVIASGYENKPGMRISGFVTNAVHFCWGEKIKERLLTYGVPNNRAITVGNISLDLIKPVFHHFIKDRSELAKQFGLDEKKKWVLFVSSFSVVNCDSVVMQEYIGAVGEDLAHKYVDVSVRSRTEILGWFDKVLQQNPDKILVYRPHPNEVVKDSDLLLNNLKEKYPNFRVIKDYAIKHWIANCDIVYNWESTSMIDILQMNDNWHIIRPIKKPLEVDYKYMASMPIITTYELFAKSFEDENYRSEEELAINKNYLEGYYANLIDDTPAYVKTADILEKILKSNEYDIHYPASYVVSCCYHFLMGFISNYIYRHRRLFGFLSPFLNKRWKSKDHLAEYFKKGYSSNVATVEEIMALEEKMRPVVCHNK